MGGSRPRDRYGKLLLLFSRSMKSDTHSQVYANVGWFLGFREQFLLETVRLDSPPQYPRCIECVNFKGVPFEDAPAPEYRCEDCRGGEWCRECVRDVHRYTPFHRIEVSRATCPYVRDSADMHVYSILRAVSGRA